jgi:drug/metabolite transporter (DMT)-like permease
MIPLYFCYRTKKQKISRSEKIRILLLGIFGIGIYHFLLNYGETNITAATASFIINQSPVLLVIFAIIFLKERLSLGGWIGLMISCAGVCIMAFGESNEMQMHSSIIYIIIVTIIAALYAVMQKPLLTKFNGVELTALIMWGGTILLSIFTPQLASEIKTADLLPTLTVVYLGIFPGVIAYSLWSIALSRTSASHAGSYLYITPILTTLIGWFFIQEIPSMLALVGGFTALTGSIVVQLSKSKEKALATE